MTLLAENDEFAIISDKLGEGAYGAVFTGKYKKDDNIALAFKFLKESGRQTGLMSSTNCRELLFLSLVTDLYDSRTSPYISLLTAFPARSLRFNQSVPESMRNCTVLVMPNYETDFYGVIFSSALRLFTPIEALFVFRELLRIVALMHSHGYAHRDLKHGNVLTDKAWNFRLIDFGMVYYLGRQQDNEIIAPETSDGNGMQDNDEPTQPSDRNTRQAYDSKNAQSEYKGLGEQNELGRSEKAESSPQKQQPTENALESAAKQSENQEIIQEAVPSQNTLDNAGAAVTPGDANAYQQTSIITQKLPANPLDLNQSGAMATLWWRAPEQCFMPSKISLYYKSYRRDGRYNDAFAIGIMCIEAVTGLMLLKQESTDEKTALAQLLATQFWMDNQINAQEFLAYVEYKLDWEAKQTFMETLAFLNDGLQCDQLESCRSCIRISLPKLVYKTLLVRFAVRGGYAASPYPHYPLLQQMSYWIGRLISVEVRNRVLVEPVYERFCELAAKFSRTEFDRLRKQYPINGRPRKEPGRFQDNLRSLGFDSKQKWFNVFKAVHDLNYNWLNDLVADFSG